MKLRKNSIPVFSIAGICLIGFLFNSCDNLQYLVPDIKDAVDLKINADLNLTFGAIAVLDDATDQLITDKVSIEFKTEKKDSAMIISIEGKQVNIAKFTGGIFQFALNKGYNPPIDLPLVVSASGYDTFYTVITLSQAQQQEFTFRLHKKTVDGTGSKGGPVSGVGIKDTILGFIGEDKKVPETIRIKTETPRATEIPGSSSSSALSTSISIEKGTVLYNKKGEPLQGELQAKSSSYDVSNPTVYANLPGSLLPGGSGTTSGSSGRVVALGGFPVEISGAPGTDGSEKTTFVSAGMLSLDMTVNGVPVDSFSKPLSVTMEMSDSIINPSTGKPIKGGDTIDLWSIDKDGTTWKWEGRVAIKGPAVDGKLKADFPVKHLSYWNLDWYYSEVCYYDSLKVTGVSNSIDLYVEPSILYPSGYEASYYRRQKMDGTGSLRSMVFMNVPKGYKIKFKFYTSQYGALAFEDTAEVSNDCKPMVLQAPSGLVSDQFKLMVIATDSTGVPIGPEWLYLYGSVEGVYESFYAYSQNDTFDISIPAASKSTITIYSNGRVVGTKTLNGKTNPAIVKGILKLPVDIPAKCTFKASIKGALTGSYVYLDAILDSKGAYPRRYSQYYYIDKEDTTLTFDQFLKDRFVKFSLYYVRGVQIPVIKDYEMFMSGQICGNSVKIDLKSFFCRPKVVLNHSSNNRNPVNVTIRTYPPANPDSANPGKSPYTLFTRNNTTDTVFYPEALPAQWPVEIIVTGTHYDSCSISRVVEVGRMEKKVLDTSYVNWNKSITVDVDDGELEIPEVVQIPVNISIDCPNLQITPSITFYYRLNCSNQYWNYGFLSMGKAILYLQKGRTYEFGIYDAQAGSLKTGTMIITDELIKKANNVSSGVNLYDEVSSPELKATLDEFCSRMSR